MKVLFIGGTGLISSACTNLAVMNGVDLYVLNRSTNTKHMLPHEAHLLRADIHGSMKDLEDLLELYAFDVVVDWIAYTRQDIERDIQLFTGKTSQYIFISSASVYQKPPVHYVITEKTPLSNPFWEYARNKIACENRLMQEYNQHGFPVTIVRPSLTYGVSQIPLCVNSWQHPYTVIERMQLGKKIIVPGDGTSLWTVTWNEDFAVGFNGLMGHEDAIGEDFHITSDEVLTWNEIYMETGRSIGVTPDIIHIPSDLLAAYEPSATGSLTGDKVNSSVFDNGKIKRFVPAFHTRIGWAEGVRKALNWFWADALRRTVDARLNEVYDTIIAAYLKAFPGGK
jgi:nucleoside-diphosphate-sugar epimerase